MVPWSAEPHSYMAPCAGAISKSVIRALVGFTPGHAVATCPVLPPLPLVLLPALLVAPVLPPLLPPLLAPLSLPAPALFEVAPPPSPPLSLPLSQAGTT